MIHRAAIVVGWAEQDGDFWDTLSRGCQATHRYLSTTGVELHLMARNGSLPRPMSSPRLALSAIYKASPVVTVKSLSQISQATHPFGAGSVYHEIPSPMGRPVRWH